MVFVVRDSPNLGCRNVILCHTLQLFVRYVFRRVSVAAKRNRVKNLVIRKKFGALDGFRTVELGKMSDVSGCFEVVWCSVLNVDRV